VGAADHLGAGLAARRCGASAVDVGPDTVLGPLLFQGTAGDARDLLIVVSATMITVTGLVFSLSVVALQIASSQFSPRLLRGFLRDRGNQVVLSVFVGTFAYATAGLHTVGARETGSAEFVPRLAVSGALFLALASLAMLVYFIHHIAHSIQIDTIMGRAERMTAQPADFDTVLEDAEAALRTVGAAPYRSGPLGGEGPDRLHLADSGSPGLAAT
jgi:uncharacterized membrane protein